MPGWLRVARIASARWAARPPRLDSSFFFAHFEGATLHLVDLCDFLGSNTGMLQWLRFKGGFWGVGGVLASFATPTIFLKRP